MPRTTKGRIYKRGSRWYLDYQANGQRVRMALKDRNGVPVGNRAEAEMVADTELRPIKAKDIEERRRLVAAALSTAEEEAERAELALRDRQERERAVANRLPISEAWKRYPYTESTRGSETRSLSPRTVKDNEGHWRTFTKWAASQNIVCVEDITEDHVRAFSRFLRDRGTTNRHNKIVMTCSVICRNSGRADPFASCSKYRATPVHRENLERDEVRNVIDTATGELRRLFILGMFTGMRLGDCVTLQWDDVHMGNGEPGRIIRRTSKTGRTVRFPLHPELRHELTGTPKRRRSGAVCPELAADYAADPSRITKTVRKLFEDCGLATRAATKDGRRKTASLRGFHSFRHSFATECARAGVPLGLVKEWLGHASPEITRIYENWKPDRDSERILAALPTLGTAPESKKLHAHESDRRRAAALLSTAPIDKVRATLAILEG